MLEKKEKMLLKQHVVFHTRRHREAEEKRCTKRVDEGEEPRFVRFPSTICLEPINMDKNDVLHAGTVQLSLLNFIINTRIGKISLIAPNRGRRS